MQHPFQAGFESWHDCSAVLAASADKQRAEQAKGRFPVQPDNAAAAVLNPLLAQLQSTFVVPVCDSLLNRNRQYCLLEWHPDVQQAVDSGDRPAGRCELVC